MPRSIVIGNGSVLVGFDANYAVRDIYFPQVGGSNQTMGNLCRTGFFIDGRFAWVSDPGWQRSLGYHEDSLVTDVTLEHPELGLKVHCDDFVDMARDWLIRRVEITSATAFQVGRVFFHYDWYIDGSDIGCTVLYEPKHQAVIAYKEDEYFLVGGQVGESYGISSWANGKKGGGAAGTWVDAEDGQLGRNPIEQGAVDCTIGLDFGPAAAGETKLVTHWVCMGHRLSDVTTFGQDLITSRGVDNYGGRTLTYWDVWSDKDHRRIEEELGRDVRQLYRRSTLTARAHVDNRGGIIASTDFDITKFARDTYAYVWPRDGAIVANALDRAGHEDITRQFFTYCQRGLVEEGYFLHKYTPLGHPGSSWHPWVNGSGERVLPIQEDETGLVLWALWQHFKIHKNLDFVVQLYSTLVSPAAEWMSGYFDSRSGMIKPSWDLWEERWGVHAFTVGTVWAGLEAAASFADLFGDRQSQGRWKAAADRLCQASDAHLYRPDMNRFVRRLGVEPDGTFTPDLTLDSAVYGLWRFGMYPPDEPRIVETMSGIRDQLWCKSEAGGLARYANDYYFQVERDVSMVPGNPWFICTLWMAQWLIAVAKHPDDLAPARAIIDWCVQHQLPGGLLSEQVDPHSGAPMSVSPLTWSHAELVVTVDEYCRRSDRLQRAASRVGGRPPA
ncbi:MAG TPA: glycoside hydrolase family 15 protein [Candidatus Acidoferrales bacterium]|nr:glycoside hydrolase family 15 protein [Candidatus Acidoferrales bacterium]